MQASRKLEPLPDVELRFASYRDEHKVWRWNNATEVRAMALQPFPIPLDEHCRWYSARLCEPGHFMWIVTSDGEDAGVLRVDARHGSPGIVAIALDQEFRGHGVGSLALAKLKERYQELQPGEPLEAWIAESNIASTRCFEGAGFEFKRAANAVSGHQGKRIFNVYQWKAS